MECLRLSILFVALSFLIGHHNRAELIEKAVKEDVTEYRRRWFVIAHCKHEAGNSTASLHCEIDNAKKTVVADKINKKSFSYNSR